MFPLTRSNLLSLKKRPDAVLFDWDDTLAHHRKTSISLLKSIMEEMTGKTYEPQEAREMLKLWYASAEQFCKTHFGDNDYDAIKLRVHDVRAAYRNKLDALPIEETEVFPDTIRILEQLKDKGVPIAIVSNKSQKRLEAEIAYAELTDYFDMIIGYEEGNLVKPDPQPIIRALKKMGLPLENIWFVGDAPEDASAARTDAIQRFHVGDFLQDIVHERHDHNDPSGRIIHLDSIAHLQPYIDRITSKSITGSSHHASTR